ncbi:MAG TPA: diguanylate cyclase [Solirubrobacteraceae bacterium]|jgi:diguanylate cyclase (GGDEF)-like protein|nr:diguanylate cyclase [Solirubrobacteraceae bacterium]
MTRSGRRSGAGPSIPAAPEAVQWRRAHAASGLTSGLVLAYVERGFGRAGVEELLERAGLSGREQELCNEDSWFDFETKIGLWDAAAAVTGDAHVAEHIGEAVLELSVGLRVKQALRALGSPEFLFRNVARANSKFNWAHTLEMVQRENGGVRLAYRDIAGIGYHPSDCQYTTGLLRTVPALFGLPFARVAHPMCGARGDDHCEFDVTWTSGVQSVRRSSVIGGILAAGLVGAGALVEPALLGVGVGVGAMTAGVTGARVLAFMRRRIRTLEAQVLEHGQEADAQLESLALLSSELQLDKALDRIIQSASTTIGGAQFALLVAEVDGMRAETHSGMPSQSLRRLAHWAHENQKELRQAPVVLDNLAALELLRPLAEDDEMPLGSACIAPLIFGDRLLGFLIALAPGATVFLPNDLRSLEIYAGHAAIALWNARLVEQLERDAAEDALTGLANRRAFDLACAAELDRAGRHGETVAMVVLDLDHFKQINDTYGHPFGDQTLVATANVLRSVVRAHDMVARIGGEEFALLLPGAAAQAAQEIAERAREQLATIALPHGALSCSAGVAVSGQPAVAGEAAAVAGELMQEADRALYEAKRQGRGRTVHAVSWAG